MTGEGSRPVSLELEANGDTLCVDTECDPGYVVIAVKSKDTEDLSPGSADYDLDTRQMTEFRDFLTLVIDRDARLWPDGDPDAVKPPQDAASACQDCGAAAHTYAMSALMTHGEGSSEARRLFALRDMAYKARDKARDLVKP